MNLKTDIDFDIKQFFQWWGRELSHCLPEKFRQKLSDRSGYVFLSATDDMLLIDQLIEGQPHKQSTLVLNETASDNYQKLIAENSELEKAEYVLRLTAGQAIKKILYLPVAAKENLQQVIAFELARVTPFKAEQVYFSVKILGKEGKDKIKVLLVLTPKDVLDGILQRLKNIQIFPAIVDYANAPNDFENDLTPYNLLPEWERPVKDKATQIVTWGLSFLAIALALGVLIFPVWQQNQEVEELRQQLKQLEAETQLVQSQQLDIDGMVDETERLINIKNRAPAITEIIDVLSKLMPDDTWLTNFKYNKDHLQIQGQSPSASILISIMETSPLFSNARFVSPLTQDKRTGMERFQIRMDLSDMKGGAEDE
jgi:general secretion pathway protein L